jgi:hypothetical protein
MALTPFSMRQLNEGLRAGGGGLMVEGSNGMGQHLEVRSGGRRWQDAVAVRPSSCEAGGR